jgi:DinB superfamily
MTTGVRGAKRKLLVDVIDAAFTGPSWHGTPLWGALRGLRPAAALWRPAPRRHNIWEELLHAAYWKDRVRARLAGERMVGGFPRRPRNFPAVPRPANARALRADLALLKECHRQLRAVVAALPDSRLGKRVGRWTCEQMIYGVAAHDLYHAGQIQLIKRLRKT